MTRYNNVKYSVLLTGILCPLMSSSGCASQPDRPNILFIVSEDNGPELGCYGAKIPTPNLDRLASEGILFSNAYVPQAGSSPSRAGFLTGLYPHQNGQIGLATWKYSMYDEDTPNVINSLKESGYRTGMVGKLHVNPESVFDLDFHKLNKGNFARKGLSRYIAYAGEFINSGNGPFYLQVNLPDAHDPWLRQVDGIPEKPLCGDEIEPMPYIGLDSPKLRTDVADYYNSIVRMDEMVGRLIDMLKKSGKYDNTLIVYIGDHGAHFFRGKISVCEGGTRIPMIISYPQSRYKGIDYDGLVSTLDLFPTFAEMSGSPLPENLPGKSLLPVICKGSRKALHKYLFTEFNVHSNHNPYPQRTVRDAQYKLVWSPLSPTESPAHRYNIGFSTDSAGYASMLSTAPDYVQATYERMLNPPEYQLYDLQDDPWEWHDLAEDPAYAEILERLKKELSGWQKATDDPFSDKELARRFFDDVRRAGLNKVTVPYRSYMDPCRDANIVGTVRADGRPLGGVSVSDGEIVVRTDRQGRYAMKSSKPCGYVFISVPGGYEAPSEGVIPRFFKYTGSVDETDTLDFELVEKDNRDFTLFVTADIHLTGDKTDDDIRQFNKWLKPDISKEISAVEGPVYSICLGDMSTDSKWYVNDFTIKDYLDNTEGWPSVIWHIPGNHDNDRLCDRPDREGIPVEKWDSLAQAPYRKHIGPNYYSMNIGECHFLMLDCIIARGPQSGGGKERFIYDYDIDSRQAEWAARDLAFADKTKPLVVCLHIPPYDFAGLEESKGVIKVYEEAIASRLMPLLEDFANVRIFSGHCHRTQSFNITDSIRQHIFVSASAVSWKINGPESRLVADDGTPGGYTIFRFSGQDVSWQFKAEGYDVGENQFRVYDLNTVPPKYGGQPESDKLLVNVYNWDEKWTVEATDDKGNRLDVRQVWTKDPLYIRIREPEFPTRPTAFRATGSLHFFEISCPDSDSKVEIEVTDRFGNRYTETVIRPKAFSWDME